MKKGMLITTALLLGLSFKSFAGTGNAKDGFTFFLAIIGFLLLIVLLLSGVDYLQKNGKTMINKAVLFIKRRLALLVKYLHKVKSDYFDLSYL